jgi:MFS superfamily sulfate permease-like transporter
MLERLKQLPGVAWAEAHPRLAAWIVLALGMVILLAIEARDVGLLPGQWIALVVATVAVAGLCIWIISWDDGDTVEDETPRE